MNSKRVLIVSPDSYGLGHYRRCLTIARELLLREPTLSILCLTGSPRPDLFAAPRGFDCVKLPSLTKSPDGEYRPLADNLDLERVARMRASIVATTMREFDPDVMLVDHSPLGALGELEPVLADVRAAGKVQTVLGLRDVIDSPERTIAEWSARGLRERVPQLFDRVLVYGDPRIYDTAGSYALPGKVRYTGVVCRCMPRSARASRFDPIAKTGRILVTTGGGCDGLPIIEDALHVLRGWRGPVRVIAGPLADAKQVAALAALVDAIPDCRVFFASRAMCSELREADAVIAMVGYNTAYEIVSSRRPYFAVPRHGPRMEQRLRAERLAAAGLAHAIDSDPTRRRASLAAAFGSASPLVSERLPDLSGAAQAAVELLSCLEASGRRRRSLASVAAERGAS